MKDADELNHTVDVDIFYIDSSTVLYIVNEATHYQAARWLPTATVDATWRVLQLCWIEVYSDPTDFSTHDAGKDIMAREFSQNSAIFDIRL